MRLGLALIAWLVTMCGTEAHTRSQTNALLETRGGEVRLSLSIEAREASRLMNLPDAQADLGATLTAHFLKTVSIVADNRMCSGRANPSRVAPIMRVDVTYQCPADWRVLELTYNAFFDVALGHFAITHVSVDGQARGEAVLSKVTRQIRISRAAQASGFQSDGIVAFGLLGVSHILEGADHLCFVLALLLFAQNIRGATLALTGFTLGHSVTLALGTLDLIRVHPPVIEALIPVTIFCAGIEALRRQEPPHSAVAWPIFGVAGLLAGGLIAGAPTALVAASGALLAGSSGPSSGWRRAFLFASGFGLIHGLAFAETLKDVVPPGGAMFAALLGFNVGVEIGQVLFAGLVVAALAIFARRWPVHISAVKYLLCCGLLLAASVWMAARLPFA